MKAEPCGSSSAGAPPPRSLCRKSARNKAWVSCFPQAPNFVPRRDSAAECGAASPGSRRCLWLAGEAPPVRRRGRRPGLPRPRRREGGRRQHAGQSRPGGAAGGGGRTAGPALKGAIVPSYSWYAPGREAPGAASSGRESEGRRVPAGGSRHRRRGVRPLPGVRLPRGSRRCRTARGSSDSSELPGGGVPRGGGGGGGDGAGSVKRRQLNDSGRCRAPAPPSAGRPPLARCWPWTGERTRSATSRRRSPKPGGGWR